MSVGFQLALSEQEKEYLRSLVPLSISRSFAADNKPLPEPPTDKLRLRMGAFVTLTINGRLRGCIGNVLGTEALFLTVAAMGRAAAFEDPRFPPLQQDELAKIKWEISVMGPLEPCPSPELIEIGRHGLLIRNKNHSGLLLPQVPVEWKWDRDTFLRQICRKAGLPDDSWKDPQSELYWFEAEVF